MPSALLLFFMLAVPSSSELRTVRILFTADLHARSRPTVDFASPGMPRRRLGGWDNLARVIDSLRTPGTLLLDCGDFAFGSPESDSAQGRGTVTFMNRARYDAACLGARDFSGGLENVELLARAAGFPVLSDPMLDVVLNRSTGLFRPYVLRDVRGVMVACIGVTDPLVAELNRAVDVRGFRVGSPIEQVRRCLPLARTDSAGLVVVFGHIGAVDGCAIADSLPEVDAVLCAGECASRNLLATGSGKPVVCAGEYGQRLGVLDLLLDASGRDVQQAEAALFNIESSEPGSAVPESTVARAGVEFASDSAGRFELALVLAEVVRQRAGASVALLPVTAVEGGLAAGPQTAYDVAGVAPYQERLRIVTTDDTGLARIVTPESAWQPMPAPAVAGGDYFVLGDTTSWPALGQVARIRLRDRQLGACKVVTTEQWLEKSGLAASGKLLAENLTDLWLGYAARADTLRPASAVRLYAATPGVVRAQSGGLVNINTADAELLCTLPGVGPMTAERIIEYRRTAGRFASVDEITNVKGIGPKRYARIRDLITVR